MEIIVVLNLKTNKVALFTAKTLAGRFTGCSERTVARGIIRGVAVKKKYLFSQPGLVKLKKRPTFRKSANFGIS